MHTTLRIQRALALRLAASVAATFAGAVFASAAAQAQTAQPAAQGTSAAPATRAPAAAPAKLDKADRNALSEMAMANMAEIATGKLALSKAVNPEIKGYAQRMVDEHTRTLAEVQALAQAKGVELPKELNVKYKAKGAMLEALKGDIFDRTYIKQSGRRDHRVTHEQLKDNMDKIKDPDIKALAMKMRPVV